MKAATLASLFALSLVCLFAAPVSAQVGEPTGFTITVQQGATTVAQHAVTIGPGGDITDIKTNDGTPLGFTQIGTLAGATGTSPIIMKVMTSDDPMFRLLSIFIDAPISLTDIDHAGPNSLFNPSSTDRISVSLTNLILANTTWAIPMLVNNNTFLTTYMRDEAGAFYELPQANAFNAHGNGLIDIQVPGERFLDGTTDPYSFAATPGAVADLTWGNLVNPGPNTTVHNGIQGGLPSNGNGYVFEIGLSVAIVGVPEPSTALLLLAGLGLIARRRR